jgi:hypothetical protein|tara:strand:- start:735 stop:1253 length:519 start_codon:yes stop_codon:yes gene_type:complete
MNSPLSNHQLESALGVGTKTITYSELRNYATIEELLPKIHDFKIILIRDRPSSGHWVNIIRTGQDNYVYFNSFGQSYNQDLYLVSSTIRKMLGSYDNYLNDLLKGKNVEYNKKKFQSNYSDVCGRWVVLNIIMITKMLFSLNDFIKFIETKKKELDYSSYDELVLKLTENIK